MAYGLKYQLQFNDNATLMAGNALPVVMPASGGNPFVNGTNTGSIIGAAGVLVFVKITLTGTGDTIQGNIGGTVFIPTTAAPFTQTYAIFSTGSISYNIAFSSAGGSCIIELQVGSSVELKIYQDGFSGSAIDLIPAESPVIISENNGSENLFNPIRAKEIKIRFVTDNINFPAVEDLLSTQDNEFKVEVYVNSSIYLIGFLLNDQIKESWYTDGTFHRIDISATDNLGTLKKVALPGFDPTDKPFLYDLVWACLDSAIPDLDINIFDNLFEQSFADRNTPVTTPYTDSFYATAATHEIVYLINNNLVYPGDQLVITNSVSNNGTYNVLSVDRGITFAHIIVAEALVDESNTANVDISILTAGDTNDAYQQCRVDARTFVTNFTSFDDCYTVLTKILESRNSTLFQHNGEWQIIRVPELFIDDTIAGTNYDAAGVKTSVSWSAVSNIHESGDLIPVINFMLKSFNTALKYNKVVFNYENFDELFCNQLWKRGGIIIDTDVLKEYDVECWNHYQGATVSTAPSSVAFRRRIEIDGPTEVVKAEYIFLEVEPLSGGESFIRSAGSLVNANDKITISLARRTKNSYSGSGTELFARVLLYAFDGTYYTLDDDGKWYLSNSTFTVNNKTIQYQYGAPGNETDRAVWAEKTVNSEFIPKDGTLFIHLQEGSMDGSSGQETWFKDLKITYKLYIEGKYFINVTGDYNKITLAANFKDAQTYTVFLSDSPKYLVKGALYRADGLTLTDLWYQMSNKNILYPIKRWNTIAHYRTSYRNFQNAEGDYYKWLQAGVPITALQKVTFNNGNPNKRFLPISLRDINLSKSQFSGFFTEVYDSTLLPPNYFTSEASFYGGLKQFFVPVQNDLLIPGNTITVTDSLLNNNTFTILSINKIDVSGVLSTYIFTAEDTAEELATPNVTFTAINANGDDVFAEHEFKYIYKNT